MHAAIFDIDGVLVDSYDAHLLSWQALARETGVRFTPREFAATFGKTSRDIIGAYWSHLPLNDALIEELDSRKEARYREIVTADFPAMPGAAELIQDLHEDGFKIALGSSGPPENVELAIDRMQFRKFLSAVVTGKDVARGKPDPQVFLLAAERLHVEPSRCIVIEDAPAGVAAARNAKMKCIALLSQGRAAEDFREAPPDIMARTLSEITPSLLRQLIETEQTT